MYGLPIHGKAGSYPEGGFALPGTTPPPRKCQGVYKKSIITFTALVSLYNIPLCPIYAVFNYNILGGQHSDHR